LATICSVGYGDIAAYSDTEALFEILVALIGACVTATISGAFAAILEEVDAAGDNAFQKKLRALEKFSKHRRLSPALRGIVFAYYRTLWRREQRYDSASSLTRMLPDPLVMKIMSTINSKVISRVHLIRTMDEIPRQRFAAAMTPQIISSQYLVYQGTQDGIALFFIIKGSILLEVKREHKSSHYLTSIQRVERLLLENKSKKIGKMLHQGHHFGESCMMTKQGMRSEQACAFGETELYVLERDKLWGILSFMSWWKKRDVIASLLCSCDGQNHTPFKSVNPATSGNSDFDNDTEEKNVLKYKTLYKLVLHVLDSVIIENNYFDDDPVTGTSPKVGRKSMVSQGNLLCEKDKDGDEKKRWQRRKSSHLITDKLHSGSGNNDGSDSTKRATEISNLQAIENFVGKTGLDTIAYEDHAHSSSSESYNGSGSDKNHIRDRTRDETYNIHSGEESGSASNGPHSRRNSLFSGDFTDDDIGRRNSLLGSENTDDEERERDRRESSRSIISEVDDDEDGEHRSSFSAQEMSLRVSTTEDGENIVVSDTTGPDSARGAIGSSKKRRKSEPKAVDFEAMRRSSITEQQEEEHDQDEVPASLPLNPVNLLAAAEAAAAAAAASEAEYDAGDESKPKPNPNPNPNEISDDMQREKSGRQEWGGGDDDDDDDDDNNNANNDNNNKTDTDTDAKTSSVA
jgi:hypothetical protein